MFEFLMPVPNGDINGCSQGLYITIHTTATCDKDARLLLQQLGIPFYGKIVD